ncbi:hypothetical protein KKF55_04660 [Patescibacteria group bacterium]|nr:hypothetical protein [Patescibacteria group bacterium]
MEKIEEESRTDRRDISEIYPPQPPSQAVIVARVEAARNKPRRRMMGLRNVPIEKYTTVD